MVGNKIVAAIRSDGKVYSLEDGGGVGVTSGSILNTNHGIFSNMANMKSRLTMSDSSDIIMANTRMQASVMDLGKKLLQCARDNDIDGVAAMMRKGAPFASDWLGMTAIHFAAVNNWYDICKLLVTSGINKDARTKVDRTPLHLAAFYGHERIVELLIEYRCALNPRDMLRMTPLHWAVEKRHKSIVRLLLKHHADVTAISKFGKTPIALAVLTEQADILQELETARQMQQSKKYNEQHEHLAGPTYQKLELSEKETNEAVNSIMGQVIDDDEPLHKKLRMTLEECKALDSPTELSVDQFDNISDEKLLDSSAINLLKSHGISMIKDEDTSNNLLTTALQNGRQLVLSEGGKMLLNEARRMGGSKNPETAKTTMNLQNSMAVAPVKVKTPPVRPNTISKPKEVFSKDPPPNNGNDKQYKNIRIISLNDFKKLYGTGNLKGLQKIESINKSQVVKIKSDDKHVYSRKKSFEENEEITCKQEQFENPEYDDEEENDLPPNIVKVSVDSEQEDSSDVDNHQTAIIHPPVQPSPEPRLLPMRHGPAANNSRPTYTRPPTTASTHGDVKQERTPVIPLLTIPEICRQLLELRKQNDELRRKYEIAQKEKEDFRNRLERLETLFLVEHAEEEYSEM